MDGRQADYQQADPASAAQYTPQQDVKYSTHTPNSDYSLNPSSARSGNFPDYVQGARSGYPDGSQRYPASSGAPGQQSGNMAQPTNPSIAASSPTYPQQQHYSPYPPQHDMHPQYHAAHPGMYRPDYPGAYPPPGMPAYGHVPPPVSTPPSMVSPATRPPGGGHPLSTVYSFVPIPGTHQQKRPRRRYEEIERMYKCGWNGCEKAYGTLNHLNAHVTMQSHGPKRTPEEFKEIRKEWKARKKEEEAQRKADEERQRQQVAQQGAVDGQQSGDGTPQQQQSAGGYPQGVQRQLPPLGYAPASGGQYGQQVDGMQQYPPGQMGQYYQTPQSPYGQQGGQMR